jgi:3-keto-L-gulonate-6-phosphate decarboxylase
VGEQHAEALGPELPQHLLEVKGEPAVGRLDQQVGPRLSVAHQTEGVGAGALAPCDVHLPACDQVELAAEAGADVVLLIGPASIANVSSAVAAARRLGVALTLDVPLERLTSSWLRDMERTGVDGFVVTTNIDLGVGGNHPLAPARMIRACSQLPVAISGGFSAADDAFASSRDWDIVIVGRSIADAVAPSDKAHQLSTIVRKINR